MEKMLQFGLMCVLFAAAHAGYSSSSAGSASTSSGLYNNIDSSSTNYGSKYPYANNFAGYAGGSAGVGSYPVFASPFVPFAGIPNPYDFNLALNQYFQSLQANFANSAGTIVYAEPGTTASATASMTGNGAYDYQNQVDSNDLYAQQFAQQAALQNAIIQQANLASGGYGGGAQYASSSAAYGPGGVYQTASIYPGNPNSPNIDTRFGDNGGSVTYTSGQPGVHGVSTSTFVASSDVNGHRTGVRESVTSVNNNGKVTTYRVRN